MLTLLLTAIKTQQDWAPALKKKYEKTTYRFFLSGAPPPPHHTDLNSLGNGENAFNRQDKQRLAQSKGRRRW